MNLLTKTELETLMDVNHPNSVSMYFPMGRNYPEDKGKKVFKNQIKTAEEDLLNHGIPAKEVGRLLQPAQDLLDTHNFWDNPSVSAAVFLHNGSMRAVNIPFQVDELHYVGPSFYLLPLFQLYAMENKFHVLALSQNSVKLYGCDFLHWEELALEGIPTSLEEALQYDDIEKERQYATRSHGSAADGTPGVQHGQGDGKDIHKTNLWRFVELIDTNLHQHLKDKDSPIILAGVDYLTAIFQKVNSRYQILETEINGNMDTLTAAQIHEKAIPIAADYYKHDVEQDLSRYHDMLSTDKTSTSIEEIATAAAKGQVWLLFTTDRIFAPGIYNPELGTAFFRDGNPDSEDLINFALVHTFKTGGKVHLLPKEQLPESDGCAALFRY